MRRVYYVSSRVAFVALVACLSVLACISKGRAQNLDRRGEPVHPTPITGPDLSHGYFVVDGDDNAPAPWRPQYFFMDTSYQRIQWTQIWTGPRQPGEFPGMYWFDPAHLNNPAQMDTVNDCMAGPIFMRLGHPFNFYGGNYDSVFISSNGFIGFLGSSYALSGSPAEYVRGGAASRNVDLKNPSTAINAPHAIIAALWADLDMAHGASPDDTSLVYFRTSASLDTFMVNYYNFRLRPASPNTSPYGWSGKGADKIFCRKFQIVLANTDSSIQINYGGFLGSINGFPPVLAYQLFEENAAIGLVSEDGMKSTSVMYGPRYPGNWDAVNTTCRTCNKDWSQSKQWAIKFKRWHDIVRAISVNYPPRNYEICLGTSVTPDATFQNVDSEAHNFKVRFAIRNLVTGIAVYSRVVSLMNIAPGAAKDTFFAAYATNPNILAQLGTFNACAIATTYDTADSNIGDRWPFDDTVCTQVFGVRRTAVPFRDPSNNYAPTISAEIPDQTLWISIGAQVVDGASQTWDPPPPGDPNGIGPEGFANPVIQLDCADINGNRYNGSFVGDTLTSFPINLQGKTKANLRFDFQRAGKFQGYYQWLWDGNVMYGPEQTIIRTDNGAVARIGDSLAIEFKNPNEPGCNPAATGWKEIAAIDGGHDFEYKSFFMSLDKGLIKIDGLPDQTKPLLNYFTADFRFRFRLKAKYDGSAIPPPNDDFDPWYIDNPTVLIPLKPEIEVMWVRVVNPYSKIPASQAVSLPVYVKIANLSSDVEVAFPIRVQILDPNGNTIYWQAVTVNSLPGGSDTVLTMPNWNAQDATQGNNAYYTVDAWLDQPGYQAYQPGAGTYTQFSLGVDQNPSGVQEFAYDNAGLDPGPGAGNDWPGITQLTGQGIGFNGLSAGSFAMKFKLSTKDTLYGVRVYFANANQAPDYIRISILDGDPNSCTPGDTVLQEGVQSTMQAQRGGNGFNQFWTYTFPKPIILPGGADGGATKGIYWASVSQLGLTNMMMGANVSRGGGIIREWDPTNISPHIEPAYDDPYGTQWSNTETNTGDVSCAWAVEAVAGSGGWAEWSPSVGWWPTNAYSGIPYSPILAWVTAPTQYAYYISGVGYEPFINAGSYTPMIRAMVSQSGLLPVELVYLKGDTANGSAILTWATAREQDNAGFTIQRKHANTNDLFSSVGFVAAAEKNSSTEQGYGFIDHSVTPGTYSYRLLQTDVNGAQHASNEVQLTIDAPNDFTLGQNYPNPFSPLLGSSTTEMSYTLPVDAPASLVIYNELGQVVKTLVNGEISQGSHTARWDGTDETGTQVASGSYICKLISGENSSAIKIVVSR